MGKENYDLYKKDGKCHKPKQTSGNGYFQHKDRQQQHGSKIDKRNHKVGNGFGKDDGHRFERRNQ